MMCSSSQVVCKLYLWKPNIVVRTRLWRLFFDIVIGFGSAQGRIVVLRVQRYPAVWTSFMNRKEA